MNWLVLSFTVWMSSVNLVAREQLDPPTRIRNIKQVRAGMTADEVRTLLGRPSRTARQILYRRYLEQWQYDEPDGLWVEFSRGKNRECARFTSRQLSHSISERYLLILSKASLSSF
jgi:hypothetical protein